MSLCTASCHCNFHKIHFLEMFQINFFEGIAQQRQVSGLQPYSNSIQHPHFKGTLHVSMHYKHVSMYWKRQPWQQTCLCVLRNRLLINYYLLLLTNALKVVLLGVTCFKSFLLQLLQIISKLLQVTFSKPTSSATAALHKLSS